MKNFRRLDYNPYIFFVDTYSQPKSSNTHQHEDVLSYVLFKRTQPVLVDSGRASYAVRDRYLDSSYHSGFADPNWPVRPNPRFFFCKTLLMQTTLAAQVSDHSASFTAHNHFLQTAKHLNIVLRDGHLSMTERLETKRPAVQGKLFHIFSDCSVELSGPSSIIHTSTDTKLIYPNNVSIHIETIERAIDYGKTIPCHRVIISPKNNVNTVTWSVEHAI
jgi:hypothetical protein